MNTKTLRRSTASQDDLPRRDGGAGTMMVLVTRVEMAERVPRGYTKTDCRLCDEPAWISPDVLEAAAAVSLGVVPMCSVCLGQA